MEDKQKVYIKGNIERGDEIIKYLEDLGGRNSHHINGKNVNAYYFINPNGIIANNYCSGSEVFPYVKEFYKEVKLLRWKPKNEEFYYFIDDRGTIITSMWNKYGERKHNLRYELGNVFKTRKEAELARDKIKEILNQ